MPRKRESKIPDEALMAEGLAAYEASQPKTANPHGNLDNPALQGIKHHNAFMWRYGWCQGYVRDTGGKDVPVFTSLPQDCTPQMSEAHQRNDVHQRRQLATALPWKMNELIGSTWVNLWSGKVGTVKQIVCNRFGRPEPAWHHWFSEAYVYVDGPGIWLDRYVIDDYIRFDTMEIELQELWKTKATRREFEDMQRERNHKQGKQKTVRAMPEKKQPEEQESQQLTLF